MVDVGDSGIAGDGYREGKKHDRASQMQTIRHKGHNDWNVRIGQTISDNSRGIRLTCDHGCHSIRNDRPKLDLIGILGKVKFFNDSG